MINKKIRMCEENMKKARGFIFVGLILFLLTSCSSDKLFFFEQLPLEYEESYDNQNVLESNPNKYHNIINNTQFEAEALYQYFTINGILAKFNITTGDITYLCDDPICTHIRDSGCLFADVGLNFIIEDGVIYYVSYDRLIKYDIAEKKAKVIYNITEKDSNILIDENTVHSGIQTAIAYGYYWSLNVYSQTFFRVDLDTGMREDLNAEFSIPSAFIDGRYYCTSNSSPATEIYSLNESMSDKHVIMDSCIIYYVEFDNVESEKNGFITFSEWHNGVLINYYMDLSSNQKFENTYYTEKKTGFEYDHYICYMKYDTEARYMGECGLNGPVYNRGNGTVYRWNTKTQTEEILFSNDDLVLSFPHVIGKYLVYDFGAFVIHDSLKCPNWQLSAGGKLVIDIENGKYHVYYNTWDKTLLHYKTSPQYQQ